MPMFLKGYYTQSELFLSKIIDANNKIISNMIKDLIASHNKSQFKADAIKGNAYYEAKHDILSRVKTYVHLGHRREDETKSNIKEIHPFHKDLVEQKAGYIAGNPIAITYDESLSETEAKTLNTFLMDLLGDSFDDLIIDWITGASNKGEEWLHFYIDAEGKFNYMITDSLGLIPVYDTQYQKKLIAMIRYYQVEEQIEVNNKTEVKLITKVEWWSEKDVTYYTEITDGSYIIDMSKPINPAPHWRVTHSNNIDNKTYSWNRVPFVKLANNTNSKTDLEPIKTLIDNYDKVKSDWVNDLEDFQELVLVLKGYAAMRSPEQKQNGWSEMDVFFHNLKTKKVIPIDEDGSVDSLKAEIPVEAKQKFLELTREEIFYFGAGVDTSNDKLGNNPSGVSLKFLYSKLDTKANIIIRKLNKALGETMYFFITWINFEQKKNYDYKTILFTFNKAMIFNEKEKIDMLKASGDLSLSKETLVKNHPLVEDPIEELARIEAEKKAEADAYKNVLGENPNNAQ